MKSNRFTMMTFGVGVCFSLWTNSSHTFAQNPDTTIQVNKFQQFKRLSGPGQSSGDTFVSPRSLEEYYARRAYPGAPPVIPHPLHEDDSKIGDNCLSCHKTGGYAPSLSRYTPVTPHPEFVNCKQCHVKPLESGMFKKSLWVKTEGPQLKQSKIPGGPPPIPHSLWLRENCQTCHTGPAAMKEIKSSHPERVHCQQCHVEQSGSKGFKRK